MARIKKSRDKILETAGMLFTQSGYDATSVHEICMIAGVSKGAFYHYFSTKQILFSTLMESWVEQVQQTLAAAGQEGKIEPDALMAMVSGAGAAFKAAPKGFPILVEFWRQAALDPETWQLAIKPYYSYMNFFESEVRKGINEGSLDASNDPKSIAHLLVAFAMGYMLQAAIDPSDQEWTSLSRDGMRMLLGGIRSK
ncbi:MAG: TetR/AcrR family transcriptional regulator [Anaerolineaceae bacterium]